MADPDSVKWVSRDQIADVVLYLAGEGARAVTGETIHVLGEGIS
jgi:enoyl-[acyl-carrier-protein] reductase (NADH)